MTHKERILRHLEDGKTITTWQAYKEYGCSRLAEYIRQLRYEGYPITGTTIKGLNRFGDKTHYTEYKLEERK